MEYNPWKFIVMLPLIMLIEGIHVICEFFRLIDENILWPAGEHIEAWMRD